ncbi:MAG: cell division protein FtsQ/DivIB [Chloroflexota bacterium]
MAKRLGSLRWPAAVVALLIVAALAYFLLLRSSSVSPRLVSSEPVAMLGSGSSAVAVAGDGTILTWLPPPEAGSLPELPLTEPPEGPRLRGSALEQARVLGAAPAALRPYLARSSYGESGVDVELSSGIELRFGDATVAARKWRAAAAVLADPEISALDYVDLHAPGHPAIYGSGHALPPVQ